MCGSRKYVFWRGPSRRKETVHLSRQYRLPEKGASGGYAEGYSVYHRGRISSGPRERFAWHNDLWTGRTDPQGLRQRSPGRCCSDPGDARGVRAEPCPGDWPPKLRAEAPSSWGCSPAGSPPLSAALAAAAAAPAPPRSCAELPCPVPGTPARRVGTRSGRDGVPIAPRALCKAGRAV